MFPFSQQCFLGHGCPSGLPGPWRSWSVQAAMTHTSPVPGSGEDIMTDSKLAVSTYRILIKLGKHRFFFETKILWWSFHWDPSNFGLRRFSHMTSLMGICFNVQEGRKKSMPTNMVDWTVLDFWGSHFLTESNTRLEGRVLCGVIQSYGSCRSKESTTAQDDAL